MTKNSKKSSPRFEGRDKAISDLRQWVRDEIDTGGDIRETYVALRSEFDAMLGEFCAEHDLPGTRYWFHPESDSYFTTAPGESLGDGIDAQLCIELKRYEFLSRQGMHFGYKPRI